MYDLIRRTDRWALWAQAEWRHVSTASGATNVRRVTYGNEEYSISPYEVVAWKQIEEALTLFMKERDTSEEALSALIDVLADAGIGT